MNHEGWLKPDKGFQREYATLPDYCHSIEAAWEILLKAEKEKRQIYLQSRNDAVRSGWTVSIDEAMEYADTAPMAICLAFLKLDEK